MTRMVFRWLGLMTLFNGVLVCAAPDQRVLEEVVVTAQKTAQSAQDVPISLTALDGDTMREVGAAGLAGMAPYIPNVRFSSETDPVLAQINIRGFGSNPLNAAFESSVGFVQDELFFGRPSYYAEAMFDIERIEVLRGPQGTLFGKNTIAGVFNVASKRPSDAFTGDVRLAGADPNGVRIEAGVGGGLTERLALRAAILDAERDGELYNQFLDRNDDRYEQQAQRLSLRFDASDDLTMTLSGVRSGTDVNYWNLQLHKLDDDTRTFLENYDPAIEDDPEDFRTSYNTPGFIVKESETVGLVVDWQHGAVAGLDEFGTVLVLGDSTMFIDSLVDLDTSPADIGRLTVVSDYEQQSAELRFNGHSEGLWGVGQGLEFVVGAFLFDSRFAQRSRIITGEDFGDYLTTDDVLQLASGDTSAGSGGLFTALNPAGLSLVGDLTGTAVGEDFYQLDYLLEVEARALFAQMSWYLDEHWVITPGLRYNREEKVVDASGQAVCDQAAIGGPCVMGTALQANDYDARGLSREETDFSPKLSVQYYFRDNLNAFVTYSRGFKSGGFNASSFSGDDLVFEPEEAATLEVGFKGKFFNDTLSLNAAVYRTEFDDLQVLAFNGAFFDVTNAASATSDGLELDFTWLTPVEALTLRGSLGLLDARYNDYPNAPAPIGQGVNATQDLGGERISLAPEQTATLSPTLMLPVFGLGLQVAFDVLYQGDQYTDTDLDPNTFVPGYTTVSGRVSLGAVDRRWALTLGGTNLTDEPVLNQVLDTVFFPGTYNVRQKGGRKVFLAFNLSW